MGTTKKPTYPSMIKEGVIYSTDKEKAEVFNNTYMDSLELLLDENIPEHDLLQEIMIWKMDVDDISKCIDTNNAYQPDNISPRRIKEARPSITKVLTQNVNKSLNIAKFPLALKRANVLPIYKKNRRFYHYQL